MFHFDNLTDVANLLLSVLVGVGFLAGIAYGLFGKNRKQWRKP